MPRSARAQKQLFENCQPTRGSLLVNTHDATHDLSKFCSIGAVATLTYPYDFGDNALATFLDPSVRPCDPSVRSHTRHPRIIHLP